MKEEELYDTMVTELTVGCIDYPSVKCGFIGEVGSVWPITGTFLFVLGTFFFYLSLLSKNIVTLSDFEKRAIRATAQAQNSLQCAVTFHPGRHNDAPFEIMRLYLEAGGKANRAIMSHLDRKSFLKNVVII